MIDVVIVKWLRRGFKKIAAKIFKNYSIVQVLASTLVKGKSSAMKLNALYIVWLLVKMKIILKST